MAITTINFTLPDLVGDTGTGGVHGLAPAPVAGDAAAGKYLKADGTWEVPPSGSGTVTDVTATAPLSSTGGATPDISADTSLGGNDVADAGKILIFNTEGQIQGSNISSGLAAVKGTSTGNGYAVHGDANTATAVVANSNSGNGIDASSISLVAIAAITFGPTNPVITVKNANAANTAPLGRFWRNDNTGLTINNNGSLVWTSTNGARDTRLNALPAVATNASKVLAVNVGETDVEWKALTATDVGADPAGSAAAAQAASQPLDSDLTAIAALITTAYGRSLLTLADAAAAKAAIGVGSRVINTPDLSATSNYTLAATDDEATTAMVRLNKATAITITFPLNATVNIPVGSRGRVKAVGAGQITVTFAGGTVVNSMNNAYKTAGQFAEFDWTKTATDTWAIDGNLTV